MVSTTPDHATRISLRATLLALVDALAYSSALAAAVGGSLALAVGLALSAPHAGRRAALVTAATFFVYGLDRLRDLPRDRVTSPARSRFVARHRDGLVLATAVAGLAALAGIATAPPAIASLCLAIGAVGLGHRRIKSIAGFKVVYVAAAWTAACVGIPLLDAMQERTDPAATVPVPIFAATFVGAALVANLIASNLRAGKHWQSAWSVARRLAVARGVAATGAALALAAPTAAIPLAAIPAAEAIALVCFRRSERYGHVAIDGCLAIGAIIAACAFWLEAGG